ncbi:MAG: amidohydrolase [Gammaproteobacteria bacterium]|nr:amidohydrolase [Gammaproteobacteria bacterium]
MKTVLAFLTMWMSGAAVATTADDVARATAAVEADVIAWRRDIHQHPELSNRETRTAALVAEHLRSLGMDVETGVAHTGVVGVLRGGLPGGVVALRADMDALPVTEQTGLAFASTVTDQYLGQPVGVMHACGHDTHVAILMGTASVLASMRASIPGTVKFIFQPAEEGAPPGEDGGAGMMVREGVLDNPKVDAIFGLHAMQSGTTGQVSLKPLGAMASADRYELVITGRQTHGAMPWAGVDPIVVGAQIVTAFQSIVSRNVDITAAPAIVTVGTFNAGVRNNIIPDSATLTGTIRTFDPQVQKFIHARMRSIAQGIAQGMGAAAVLDIVEATPVTFNDAALTQRMRPTLVRVFGETNVLDSPLITGAEDFAYYQQQVPGLFFFLGVRPVSVAAAKAVPNHSPFFDADEAALAGGVRAMANLALDYLSMSDR